MCNLIMRLFSEQGFDVRDIYAQALAICQGVQQVGSTDATLVHFVEVLKGSMNQKVVKDGHDKLAMHGLLKSYKKNDIERIMRQLICESYLVEDVVGFWFLVAFFFQQLFRS